MHNLELPEIDLTEVRTQLIGLRDAYSSALVAINDRIRRVDRAMAPTGADPHETALTTRMRALLVGQPPQTTSGLKKALGCSTSALSSTLQYLRKRGEIYSFSRGMWAAEGFEEEGEVVSCGEASGEGWTLTWVPEEQEPTPCDEAIYEEPPVTCYDEEALEMPDDPEYPAYPTTEPDPVEEEPETEEGGTATNSWVPLSDEPEETPEETEEEALPIPEEEVVVLKTKKSRSRKNR